MYTYRKHSMNNIFAYALPLHATLDEPMYGLQDLLIGLTTGEVSKDTNPCQQKPEKANHLYTCMISIFLFRSTGESLPVLYLTGNLPT